LFSVKKANAHFSDDLLSTLLNEPIPGHGIFWSSAGGKSYPIPLRVLSFEQAYSVRDPKYGLPAAKTFAEQLKKRFLAAVSASRAATPAASMVTVVSSRNDLFADDGNAQSSDGAFVAEAPEDILGTHSKAAIAKVAQDQTLLEKLRGNGVPWKGVLVALEQALPDVLNDRNKIAYDLVREFMNEIFGASKWQTERRQSTSGSGMTTWVVLKK
jgi:hypothetical protein